MAEATAASPGRAGQAPPAMTERAVYQAGGVRKTFFAFTFLLLLPFFASLPVMLYERLSKGVLIDTWGLIVIAVCFTLVMALLLFELMYSLRARIELGERALRFALPASRSGIPALRYRRVEIPYQQIAAVETRCEIYGGAIAPVLMRGVRIITKDGQQHSLGYVSEDDMDPLFPAREIAESICRNAGLNLMDRGNVRRRLRRKLFGIKAGDEDNIPEADIESLNRKHRRFVLFLVACMVLLLVAGISTDFATGTIDRGERAHDSVQKAPTPVKTQQK